MAGTSNSSRSDIPALSVAREWFALFRMRMRGLWRPNTFDGLFSQLSGYRERLLELSGVELQNAQVLEIGFGQRPNRLRALQSMGVNVVGVDLDRPVLRGSFSEFVQIARRNGFQRMLKSVVRHHLFDGHEQGQLSAALQRRGYPYRVDLDKFYIGSVSSDGINSRIAPRSLDLIFSEDVFEHIPPEDLIIAIGRMRDWLKPSGVALIRLTLFTGITGGHHVEWYPHTLEHPMARRTEPWDHLRKRQSAANTYLNEVRLPDYVRLFSEHFEVLEIHKEKFGLGSDFLSQDVRQDLQAYSDEELLSNEVLFVLKPKDPVVLN